MTQPQSQTMESFEDSDLDSTPSAADEADMEAEGFEEGDAYVEDSGDEFDEEAQSIDALEEDGFSDDAWVDDAEGGDYLDALEAAVADSIDAADEDEFLGALLGNVGRIAGIARRGAGLLGRGAGIAGRFAGRVAQGARAAQGVAGRAQQIAGRAQRIAGRASQAQNPLGYLMQILGQHLNQPAADESELFDDLADLYEDEEIDAAIPLIAGVAARTLVRPILRRTGARLTQPVRRAVVRGATRAARALVQRQGPRAVRALQPIARRVASVAARRGMPASQLPRAIQRTAARVAARPRVVRRLAAATPRRAGIGGRVRRIRLRGPVELTIQGG